jgi:hypothetical protein
MGQPRALIDRSLAEGLADRPVANDSPAAVSDDIQTQILEAITAVDGIQPEEIFDSYLDHTADAREDETAPFNLDALIDVEESSDVALAQEREAFLVFLGHFAQQHEGMTTLLAQTERHEFFKAFKAFYESYFGRKFRGTELDKMLGLSNGSMTRYMREGENSNTPLRYTFFGIIYASVFFKAIRSRILAVVPERFRMKGIPGSVKRKIDQMVEEMELLDLNGEQKLDLIKVAVTREFNEAASQQVNGYLRNYHPDLFVEKDEAREQRRLDRNIEALAKLANPDDAATDAKADAGVKILDFMKSKSGYVFEELIAVIQAMAHPDKEIITQLALTVKKDAQGRITHTTDIADITVPDDNVIYECKLGRQDPNSVLRQVEKQIDAADRAIAAGEGSVFTSPPTITIVVNEFDKQELLPTQKNADALVENFEENMRAYGVEGEKIDIDQAAAAIREMDPSTEGETNGLKSENSHLKSLREVASKSKHAARIEVVSSAGMLNASASARRRVAERKYMALGSLIASPESMETPKRLAAYYCSVNPGARPEDAKKWVSKLYRRSYGATPKRLRAGVLTRKPGTAAAIDEMLKGLMSSGYSNILVSMHFFSHLIDIINKRDLDRPVLMIITNALLTLRRLVAAESVVLNKLSIQAFADHDQFITRYIIEFGALFRSNDMDIAEAEALVAKGEAYIEELSEFANTDRLPQKSGSMECQVVGTDGRVRPTHRAISSKRKVPKWLREELTSRGIDDIDALLEVDGAMEFVEDIVNGKRILMEQKREDYPYLDEAQTLLHAHQRVPRDNKLKMICRKYSSMRMDPTAPLALNLSKTLQVDNDAVMSFSGNNSFIIMAYGNEMLVGFWNGNYAAHKLALTHNTRLGAALGKQVIPRKKNVVAQVLGRIGLAKPSPQADTGAILSTVHEWMQQAEEILAISRGVDHDRLKQIREKVVENGSEMLDRELQVMEYMYDQHSISTTRILLGKMERLVREVEYLESIDPGLAEAALLWHLNHIQDISPDAQHKSPQFREVGAILEALTDDPSQFTLEERALDPVELIRTKMGLDSALSSRADSMEALGERWSKDDCFRQPTMLDIGKVILNAIKTKVAHARDVKRYLGRFKDEVGLKNMIPMDAYSGAMFETKYDSQLRATFGDDSIKIRYQRKSPFRFFSRIIETLSAGETMEGRGSIHQLLEGHQDVLSPVLLEHFEEQIRKELEDRRESLTAPKAVRTAAQISDKKRLNEADKKKKKQKKKMQKDSKRKNR